MTREEFVSRVDNISEEIKEFNQKLTIISGMLAVLRQSTKETDLAMNSLISLIENNVNDLIGKKVDKLNRDISEVLKLSESIESKVVKPRKPRVAAGDKKKRTRKKEVKVEEKLVEQVEKEEVAE